MSTWSIYVRVLSFGQFRPRSSWSHLLLHAYNGLSVLGGMFARDLYSVRTAGLGGALYTCVLFM